MSWIQDADEVIVEFELQPADLKKLTHYSVFCTRSSKLWIARWRGILFVAFLVPIAASLYSPTQPRMMPVVAAIFAVLAAVVAWIAPVSIRKAGERIAIERQLAYTPQFGHWKMTVTKDAIRHERGDRSGSTSWEDVLHVDRNGNDTYVFVSKKSAEIFPSSAFECEDEAARFAQLCEDDWARAHGRSIPRPGESEAEH